LPWTRASPLSSGTHRNQTAQKRCLSGTICATTEADPSRFRTAVCLRARYAMPGNDIGCAAIRLQLEVLSSWLEEVLSAVDKAVTSADMAATDQEVLKEAYGTLVGCPAHY